MATRICLQGKLNAFEKANSAKLVMQLSEKEGERASVEPGSVIFYEPGILRTACEVGLSISLIFFGPEPPHVLFGTERKQ